MIKYIITFVLIFIFSVYSIIFVSKGMDGTICTESFTNDYKVFLNSVEKKDCNSNQKLFMKPTSLDCINECSQSDVIFNSNLNTCTSNWCTLSNSESNYSAKVISRCYVGDSLYELNSNVYIGCDSDQVPSCSNCEITVENECALNDNVCEKTVTANVPDGYSRCKLDSSVYGVDHLESPSNFVIGCSNNECANVITTYTKRDGDFNIQNNFAVDSALTVDGCKKYCSNMGKCLGFTRDTSNSDTSPSRCWFIDKNKKADIGSPNGNGNDETKRTVYQKEGQNIL